MLIHGIVKDLNQDKSLLSMSGATMDKMLESLPSMVKGLHGSFLKSMYLPSKFGSLGGEEELVGEDIRKLSPRRDRSWSQVVEPSGSSSLMSPIFACLRVVF